MNRRLTFITVPAVLIAVLVLVAFTAPSSAGAGGASQISGIGYFAGEGECADPQGAGADFALTMTGDLEGCLYTFVETSVCSPSGTYIETGTETFIGQDSGDTFTTTYKFEAKYQDCANLAGEIFGRCQHPIVAGSGTGIYTGVTGRIDFKDDVEAGNFLYRGNLKP